MHPSWSLHYRLSDYLKFHLGILVCSSYANAGPDPVPLLLYDPKPCSGGIDDSMHGLDPLYPRTYRVGPY